MPEYTAPERERVALLTVNGQRDFVRDGSFLKAGGTRRACAALRATVEAFRAAGAPVFHAVRLYRPDGSNVDIFRRKAVEEGLRVLMPGSLGAELIDGLKPQPEVRLDADRLLEGRCQEIGPREWAFYKPRWGAFHGTALDRRLEEFGITTLAVCGCNFSTSGRATVYEAGARDYRVILVTDALSGAREESLLELGRIGVYLMTAESCRAWLSAGRTPAVA